MVANNISSNLIILRRKEVEARTGLSRSSIYKRIAMGSFPAQVSLGGKAVGWVEAEINTFLSSRIADRDAKCGKSVDAFSLSGKQK